MFHMIRRLFTPQIRRNQLKIKEMADHDAQVQALRDSKWVTTTTCDIVPGDLVGGLGMV